MKSKKEILEMYIAELKEFFYWENSDGIPPNNYSFHATSKHFRCSGFADVLERDFPRDINRLRRAYDKRIQSDIQKEKDRGENYG